MQENLWYKTHAHPPFYACVYFSSVIRLFLVFAMIAVQTLTGGVLSRTVNVSACRPHWCIWVTSSQAAEVASRDSRFCHTLPNRPAHIHGGKVQRDC